MDVMKLAIVAAWATILGSLGGPAYAADTAPKQAHSASVGIEARLTVLPACNVTTGEFVRETANVRTTCSQGLVPGVSAEGARSMETIRLAPSRSGEQTAVTPVSVERTRSADSRSVLVTVEF